VGHPRIKTLAESDVCFVYLNMNKITQKQHYADVHLLAAPARAAKSIFQMLAIVALLILLGAGYPLYLLFNGQPVTAVSLVICGLTVLAVATLIYAPVYFLVGGIVLFIAFTSLVSDHESIMFTYFGQGWGFSYLILAFLSFGILQRYIRHRLFDAPKPRDTRPADWMGRKDPEKPQQMKPVVSMTWEEKRDRLTRRLAEMGPLEYQTLCNLYGDDPKKWPDDLVADWDG